MTFTARIVPKFASIEAEQWDALDHQDNPFLSHAFLSALESSESVAAESGWVPHHLAIYEGDRLLAFAPTYLKAHSHGEFVFDWAWADAYRRYGLAYYPKLLTAVPYSPVGGPRLLTRRGDPAADTYRRQLIDFALAQCEGLQLSSWHCNFVTDADRQALESADLLARTDWQFHWRNEGFTRFEDFLESLRSRKRKNIRREREQVRRAGLTFRWLRGSDVGEEALAFLYRCYLHTFRAYGNHPALKLEFFRSIAEALDERFLVLVASRDSRPVAMSLFLAGGGRLYGRYWGCTEEIPGLHFEAAYYRGIEYCIENSLQVFESGAQGEHKISRGFLPERTHSFHHLRDARFREAIARHLVQERAWLAEYREELALHDPYRRDGA